MKARTEAKKQCHPQSTKPKPNGVSDITRLVYTKSKEKSNLGCAVKRLLRFGHGYDTSFGYGKNIIGPHRLDKRLVLLVGRKGPRVEDIGFTIAKDAAGSCIAIEFHFV